MFLLWCCALMCFLTFRTNINNFNLTCTVLITLMCIPLLWKPLPACHYWSSVVGWATDVTLDTFLGSGVFPTFSHQNSRRDQSQSLSFLQWDDASSLQSLVLFRHFYITSRDNQDPLKTLKSDFNKEGKLNIFKLNLIDDLFLAINGSFVMW